MGDRDPSIVGAFPAGAGVTVPEPDVRLRSSAAVRLRRVSVAGRVVRLTPSATSILFREGS
jgi:hypothetical protein